MRWQRWALLFGLLTLPQTAGADDSDAPGCVFEGNRRRPAEIIQPCTALLANPKLSNEERAGALFARGRAYHNLMQLSPALADYTKALELTPFNVNILLARANIYARTGQLKLQMLDLLKAVNNNPDNPDVMVSVGNAYSDAGLNSKAIDAYTRAIELDPKKTFAYVFRGNAYMKNSELDKALADADSAVLASQEPDQPNYFVGMTARDLSVVTLIERARILEKMGEIERSQQDYDQAVSRDRSGYALTKRAHYAKRDPAAAIADLREAIRREPTYGTAFFVLGVKLTEIEENEGAFIAFNEVIALDPHDGHALRMRAYLHRKLGQHDAAFDDLIKAIKVDHHILADVMPSLRSSGYWSSMEVPTTVTPAMQDALRACMIDPRC
jgi:tetratricopeptide (TPR) repeat protein